MDESLLRRYTLYLLRWQLSTIVLAPCVRVFAGWGYVPAVAIGNLVGGLIFFWVDRFIFYHRTQIPVWEVVENVACADCAKNCVRGYRLVSAPGYDRLNDPSPEYRCESCSVEKYHNWKLSRPGA